MTHSLHTHHKHQAWDNSIPPVVRVSSGAVIEFDCLDACHGQLNSESTSQDIAKVNFELCNPIFGPVYVEQAKPGDILEIEFLELTTGPWGFTAIFPGFGLLADDFGTNIGTLKHWKIADGYATASFGKDERQVKLPSRPFCGEIGVARAEKGAHSTIPPYSTGGNIDTRHLVKGSTIYLPVEVEGALFSLGDGHALQGDGEVCGCAIETNIQAKVQLRLIPAKESPYPVQQPQYKLPPCSEVAELQREGFHTTMGIDSDLLEASRKATRHAIEVLLGVSSGNLSKEDAYILLSVAGDLQILEIVDLPNFTVGMRIPEYVLKQIRV